jgi:Sec-independent protein secretion pathway component TatC
MSRDLRLRIAVFFGLSFALPVAMMVCTAPGT